ncbi:hypothetical protein BpHYR1_000809 [Brachionus plicatilis]|uniref:Uncharacterized protein n=1 Tax=Brachionus plicatilis TaxID=10195 RepID=A0A3M7PUI2_BRAPC|nr:hypothetical protein BpHYR1_000809 [Brachionus plicatilis]
MHNGLKIVKLNYKKKAFYLNWRYSSHVSYKFKQNIEILDSNLVKNQQIDGKLFTKLVKEIETEKVCDSKSGLTLLKSCGLNYIDTFPAHRQTIVDYLFNILFKKISFEYQSLHYEAFLNTTIANQASFDPLRIEDQLKKHGLAFNQGICLNLINQLCNQNQLKLAFLFLKQIVETDNLAFDSDKLQRYDSLSNQDKIDAENLKTDHVQLINPLIYINNRQKYRYLIELIEYNFQTLNRSTLSSILKGNLILADYGKAVDILNQNGNLFLPKDLLDFYHVTSLDKNCRKNEFTKQLAELISEKISSEDLIYLIDLIYKLTCEKKFNLAAEILKICGQIEFSVNLDEYFLKSAIEYESEYKKLANLAGLYGDKAENLKNLLNFSLAKQNSELSLKLIWELKTSGETIRPCYFYPILDKESAELVEDIKKSGKNIEKCLNYKRIDSIFKKIRSDFNVLMGKNDLKEILEIFRSNDPAYLMTFDKMCHLFDKNQLYNTLTLFNVSSEIILDSQLELIDQNRFEKNYGLDANMIQQIFGDISNLIDSLNINIFNESFLSKLHRFLIKLYETDLIFTNSEINQNKVIATLKIINQRYHQKEDNILNDINKSFKQYSVKFSSSSQDDSVLVFKVVESSLKRHPGPTNAERIYSKNTEYSDKSESVEDLVNLIEELESKEKNVYPSVRRLLMRLCHSNEVENPIELIERYGKSLPIDQLTPKLCHDLMHFYVRRTFDFDKAKFYFEKLKIFAKNKDKFQPDAIKLISFCEVLFNGNKINFFDLEEIFKIFKWTNANNDQKSLEKMNEFLNGKVFTNLSPSEYKILVECIFESNIISRNSCFGSMVLSKFIESNLNDEALSYFKYNLVEHKTSIGEVLILKSFFKQYEKKLLTGTKLEELMLVFSKYYSPSLAFNFMFYAYCMNGDFFSARAIFNQNLDKNIDLNILERLVNQIGTNQLNKKHSAELKNVLKFMKFDKDTSLKNKIKIILNKLS